MNRDLKHLSFVLVAFGVLWLLSAIQLTKEDPPSMSVSATNRRTTPPPTPLKTNKTKPPKLHLWELCPNTVIDLRTTSDTKFKSRSGTVDDNLVYVQKGDLPIVISVPHGATPKDSTYKWQSKNLPVRGAGDGDLSTFEGRLARVNSDTNTIELGKTIASAIAAQFKGRKPYVVIARFHRRFIDVNRRRNHTEECCPNMWTKCTAIPETHVPGYPNAKRVFDAYHKTLADALREQVGAGRRRLVVLDIHAQRAQEDPRVDVTPEQFLDSVIVGTQDGRCVKDRTKLYSNSGFLGLLAQKMETNRLHVYPPNDATPDHPKYNGGHITAVYGFDNTVGAEVDAIQMEFGGNLRMKLKSNGKKVAQAIAQSLAESGEYV